MTSIPQEDWQEFRDHNGTMHRVRPEVFWHLTSPNHFLLHNAFLAKGFVPSMSAVRAMGGGLENAVSPYGRIAMHDAKEKVWEEIRIAVQKELPSRAHAFFLLPSQEALEIVRSSWFKDEPRVSVEARVVVGATMHIADAKLLDCEEASWKSNAEAYWRGAMTPDPIPEVLVEGLVYFPGWASSPFGLMKP